MSTSSTVVTLLTLIAENQVNHLVLPGSRNDQSSHNSERAATSAGGVAITDGENAKSPGRSPATILIGSVGS